MAASLIKRMKLSGIGIGLGILFPTVTAAQHWVNPVLITPPPTGGAPPTSGYLRISVTSNLDPLTQAPDNFRFDNKFGLLTANVEVTTPGSSPVDYPVAAFDIGRRQKMSLAAFQLGESQYINLESGSRPQVSITVRAVPKTLAGAVTSALNKFSDLAANPLISGFIPLPSQVTALTGIVTSVIRSDPNEVWENRVSMSLNAGDAGLMALPIGDRPAIVFLRSTRNPAPIPSWSQVKVCQGAPGSLCMAADNQPYRQMPYLLITAKVDEYRPITDFRVPSLTCGSQPVDFEAVREAVRRSPLTDKQRFMEERLLDLYALNLAVRAGAIRELPSTADLAYRWARRPRAVGDSYWNRHAGPRATNYENCLSAEVASLGAAEGRRWEIFSVAFEAARSFNPAALPADQGQRRNALDLLLDKVTRPITVYKLDEGEAYSALRDAQDRMEKLLLPADIELANNAVAAMSAAQLQVFNTQVKARLEETYCASCRQVLAPAYEQVKRKLAALPANPSTVAAAAANLETLAAVQQEGVQLAAVASTLELDTVQRAALSQQLQTASQILSNPNSSPAQIQQAIAALQNQMQPLRQAASAPPN